ncbi:MBL fold metallo-hydrolase [Frondihabitans sucicola]|uniref:MBL fold metallo-hydrolase n=1 Tax=Frondihabitans sucicola TaxID=1268041 RepID=A0ABM8GJ97_9MICO|nr:MBL fold metallo-hydrolase [Frondihabitans sucicola]BDZ48452.1 MBL fold metallo-hydrolase [Frondihabitans sucicola]
MELTKHTHATVVLSKGEGSLVIDPGAYTPNAADLVADATAVLITHAHPDHFDAGILDAALDAQPALTVYAPGSVAAGLGSHDGRVVTVAAGDTFAAAGFDVAVFGEEHAVIHPDVPVDENVGFLVDDVFHPGDAYLEPGVAVETLLLPTSGPWVSMRGAVDYVRAVKPAAAVQIHDLMLSDAGKGSTEQFLKNLTGVGLTTLQLGESVTL